MIKRQILPLAITRDFPYLLLYRVNLEVVTLTGQHQLRIDIYPVACLGEGLEEIRDEFHGFVSQWN